MSTRRERKKKRGAPAAVQKSHFDVIVTFREREQVFLDPFDVTKGISELGFVRAVFAELDDGELDELVKISACMHAVPGEAIESWIPTRQGKFYFNPEHNSDDDTAHWAFIKTNELLRRKNLGQQAGPA